MGNTGKKKKAFIHEEEEEQVLVPEVPWWELSDDRRFNKKKHRVRGRGRPSM